MLVRERAQTLDDILPLDAATVGVLAESTRYQGEWNDNDIYLAVGTDGTAYVLSIPSTIPTPGAPCRSRTRSGFFRSKLDAPHDPR